MKWRIIYNILIFISVALLIWPLYTALILAGVFLYKKFFESFLWVLVVEIILGPTGVGLIGHYYLWFVVLVLIASMYVKKVMRYYE